jgi:hypothetical protein
MKTIIIEDLQFYEWFQYEVREDEQSVNKSLWSDGATFKLNGTIKHHKCVYWAPESPHTHIDKMVNIPGLAVWCRLSCRGFNWTVVF